MCACTLCAPGCPLGQHDPEIYVIYFLDTSKKLKPHFLNLGQWSPNYRPLWHKKIIFHHVHLPFHTCYLASQSCQKVTAIAAFCPEIGAQRLSGWQAPEVAIWRDLRMISAGKKTSRSMKCTAHNREGYREDTDIGPCCTSNQTPQCYLPYSMSREAAVVS